MGDAASSAAAPGSGAPPFSFSASGSAPAFSAGSNGGSPAFGAAGSAPAFGGFGTAGNPSAPAFGATPAFGFGTAGSAPAFGGFGAAGNPSAPAFGASPAFGFGTAGSAPAFGAAPSFGFGAAVPAPGQLRNALSNAAAFGSSPAINGGAVGLAPAFGGFHPSAAQASCGALLWECRMDSGQWVPFPADVSQQIEAQAAAAGATAATPFSVRTKFGMYIIHLDASGLGQGHQENASTHFKRPIRRQAGEGGRQTEADDDDDDDDDDDQGSAQIRTLTCDPSRMSAAALGSSAGAASTSPQSSSSSILVGRTLITDATDVPVDAPVCCICQCDMLDGAPAAAGEGTKRPLDSADQLVRLDGCCRGLLHVDCVDQFLASQGAGSSFLTCPLCTFTYGVRTGVQPYGTMSIRTVGGAACDGYQSCGTLVIEYEFPSGKQGAEHYHPGTRYRGTSRTTYLPDCPEGRAVLALLEVAFMRRLCFTVGDSVTTGASDCVVWNGVHHKTAMSGGSSNFGYPDTTYFARVTAELSDKGVTAACVPQPASSAAANAADGAGPAK